MNKDDSISNLSHNNNTNKIDLLLEITSSVVLNWHFDFCKSWNKNSVVWCELFCYLSCLTVTTFHPANRGGHLNLLHTQLCSLGRVKNKLFQFAGYLWGCCSAAKVVARSKILHQIFCSSRQNLCSQLLTRSHPRPGNVYHKTSICSISCYSNDLNGNLNMTRM
jgi:hypothetical protein